MAGSPNNGATPNYGGVTGNGATPNSGGVTGSGGAVATSGAGGATPTGAGGEAGAPPAVTPDFSHTFPSITLNPGEEVTGRCQSVTLNNDSPIFVNKIVATNEGRFHHSNWIWVPDTSYTGPDGTWTCTDRGFDQVLAGAFGGVFFAQSTQSGTDTQAFPPGVAFQVPAHARVIGDVHLVNSASTPFTTSFHFDVYGLPQSDVRVELQPMAFTNLSLDIAPMMETQARMQCATPQPDFDVYYVLPHFHVLGQWLSVDVAGGAMNGTNIFRSQGSFGDSMGRTFDPPVSVVGASGLVITCDYQSTRSATVHYGNGDQEMCVALLYSSGKKAGGETLGNPAISDSGGVHTNDALCVSVGAP
jgi:hypothetical protein